MKKTKQLALCLTLLWVAALAQAAGVVYQNMDNQAQIELTNIQAPDRNDRIVATDAQATAKPMPQTRAEPAQPQRVATDSGTDAEGSTSASETAGALADGKDSNDAPLLRGRDGLDAARGSASAIDLNPDGKSELGSNTRAAGQLGATSSVAATSAASVSSEVPQASDAQLEQYRDLMLQKAAAPTYYITGNPAESRRYLMINKATYVNGG